MSLINKMLRDLDSRHAVSGQVALPTEVRALPEPKQPPRIGRRIWLLLALVVLGCAAFLTSAYWLPLLRPLLAPTAAPGPAVPARPKPPPAAPAISPAAHPATAPAAAPAPVAATPAPAPASQQPASTDTVLPLPSISETLPPPEEPPASSHQATTKAEAAIHSPPAVPAKRKPRPLPTAKKPEQADAHVLIDKTQSPEGRAAADYLKGVAAYKQGRMAEAAAQFRLALQADPRHLAARQTLIAMLAGQKQWDDAEALLREGLQLMPGQTAWAMALARIEVERGDLTAAWGTLQRHMADARNDADYLGFAGVLLERLHKPHEAAGYYQAALHLKPRAGRWWLGLGLALEADGRAAEAQDAYRHAEASEGLTPEMKAFVDKKLH